MKSSRRSQVFSSLASSALGARGHMSLDEGMGIVTAAAAVAAASKQQGQQGQQGQHGPPLDKKTSTSRGWNNSTRASPLWKKKSQPQENKENRAAPKKFQHVQSKLAAPIYSQRRSGVQQSAESSLNSGLLSAGVPLRSSSSVGNRTTSSHEQLSGTDVDAVDSSEAAMASLPAPFVTVRRGNMPETPLDGDQAFVERQASMSEPVLQWDMAAAASSTVSTNTCRQQGAELAKCDPLESSSTDLLSEAFEGFQAQLSPVSCAPKPAPSHTPPECTNMVLALEGAAQAAEADAASEGPTPFKAWLTSMGINNSPLPESALRVLWQKTVQQEALIEQLKESELQLAQQEAEERARHVGILLAENEDLLRAKARLQREALEAKERLEQLRAASMPVADSPAVLSCGRRFSADWGTAQEPLPTVQHLSPRDEAYLVSPRSTSAAASGVQQVDSLLLNSLGSMGGIASPDLWAKSQNPILRLSDEPSEADVSVTSVFADECCQDSLPSATQVATTDIVSPSSFLVSDNWYPKTAASEVLDSNFPPPPSPSSHLADLAIEDAIPALDLGGELQAEPTPAAASVSSNTDFVLGAGSTNTLMASSPLTEAGGVGLGAFGPSSPCTSLGASVGASWNPQPPLGPQDVSSPSASPGVGFDTWATNDQLPGNETFGAMSASGETASTAPSPGLSHAFHSQNPVGDFARDAPLQEGDGQQGSPSLKQHSDSSKPPVPASTSTPISRENVASPAPACNPPAPLQPVPVSPQASAAQLRSNPLYETDSPASCMSGALPERTAIPGHVMTPVPTRMPDFGSLASTPMSRRSDFPSNAPTPDYWRADCTPSGRGVGDAFAFGPFSAPAFDAGVRASAADLQERLVAASSVTSTEPCAESIVALPSEVEAASFGGEQEAATPRSQVVMDSPSSAVATKTNMEPVAVSGLDADAPEMGSVQRNGATDIQGNDNLAITTVLSSPPSTAPGEHFALCSDDEVDMRQTADTEYADLGDMASPVAATNDAFSDPSCLDAGSLRPGLQMCEVGLASPDTELSGDLTPAGFAPEQPADALDTVVESSSPATEADGLEMLPETESTGPEMLSQDDGDGGLLQALLGSPSIPAAAAVEEGNPLLAGGVELFFAEDAECGAQNADQPRDFGCSSPSVADNGSSPAKPIVEEDEEHSMSPDWNETLGLPSSPTSRAVEILVTEQLDCAGSWMPAADSSSPAPLEDKLLSVTSPVVDDVLPQLSAEPEEHPVEQGDAEGLQLASNRSPASASSSPATSVDRKADAVLSASNIAALADLNSEARSAGVSSRANSYPSTPKVNRQDSPTSTMYATPLDAFPTPTSLVSFLSAARLTALQMYGSVPNSVVRELTPGAPTPSEFSFGFGRQLLDTPGLRPEAPTPAFGPNLAAGLLANADATTPRLGPHSRAAGLAAFGSPLPVMKLTPVQLRVLDKLAGEVIAALSPVPHGTPGSYDDSPSEPSARPATNHGAQAAAGGFNMAQLLAQLHSPLPAAMQPQARRMGNAHQPAPAKDMVAQQHPSEEKEVEDAIAPNAQDGGVFNVRVEAATAVHAPSPARNFSKLMAFLSAAGQHAPTPGVRTGACYAADSADVLQSTLGMEAIEDGPQPEADASPSAAAHRDAVAAAAVISFAQLLAHIRSPLPQGAAARSQLASAHPGGDGVGQNGGVDSPVTAAGAHGSPATSEAASFGFSTAAKHMAVRMTPTSTPGDGGGVSFLRWANEAPPSFRLDSDLRSTARHARSASNPPSPMSFCFGHFNGPSAVGDFTPTVGGGQLGHARRPSCFTRSSSHHSLSQMVASPQAPGECEEAGHRDTDGDYGRQHMPLGMSPAPSLGTWNFLAGGTALSCAAAGSSPTPSQLGFTFGNTCPSAAGTPLWFFANAAAAACGTPAAAEQPEGAGAGGSVWDQLVAMSPTFFRMASEGSPEDTPRLVQQPPAMDFSQTEACSPEAANAGPAAAAAAGVPGPVSFWTSLLGNLLSPLPAVARGKSRCNQGQASPSQQSSKSNGGIAISFNAHPTAGDESAAAGATVALEKTFSFAATPSSAAVRVASRPEAELHGADAASRVAASTDGAPAVLSQSVTGVSLNTGTASGVPGVPDDSPPPQYDDLPDLIARGLCLSALASAEQTAPMSVKDSEILACSSMGENATPLACHLQVEGKVAPVVLTASSVAAAHAGSDESPVVDRLFTPTRRALASASSVDAGCSRAVPASLPTDTLLLESVTGSNRVGTVSTQGDVKAGCTTDPIVTPSRLVRAAASSYSVMSRIVTSSSAHNSPVLSFGAANEDTPGSFSQQLTGLANASTTDASVQGPAMQQAPSLPAARTEDVGQDSQIAGESIGFSVDAVEQLLFDANEGRGDEQQSSVAGTQFAAETLPMAVTEVAPCATDSPDGGASSYQGIITAEAVGLDAVVVDAVHPGPSETTADLEGLDSEDTEVTAGSEVASAAQAAQAIEASAVASDREVNSASVDLPVEGAAADAATPGPSPAHSAHPSIFDGVQPASSNTPFSYLTGTVPPTPWTADLASTSKSVALPGCEHVPAAGHFWAPSPSGLKGAITERVTLEVLNRRISANADLLLDFQGSPGHPHTIMPSASITGATTPRLKGTGACTSRSLMTVMVSPGRKSWTPPHSNAADAAAGSSPSAATASAKEASPLPKFAANAATAEAPTQHVNLPAVPTLGTAAQLQAIKVAHAVEQPLSARARLLLCGQAPPVQQLVAASLTHTLASAAAAVLHPAGVPAVHMPLSQRLGLRTTQPAAWGVPFDWPLAGAPIAAQQATAWGAPAPAQPGKPTATAQQQTDTGPTPVQQAGPLKPNVTNRDVQTTPGLVKLFNDAAEKVPEVTPTQRAGVPSLPRPPAVQTAAAARKSSFRSRIPTSSTSSTSGSDGSSVAAPVSADTPTPAPAGSANADDGDGSSPSLSTPLERIGRRGRLLSNAGGPQRVPVKLGEEEVRRRANVLGMRISPYLRSKQLRARGPQAPKAE